jgi:hypothetical protein
MTTYYLLLEGSSRGMEHASNGLTAKDRGNIFPSIAGSIPGLARACSACLRGPSRSPHWHNKLVADAYVVAGIGSPVAVAGARW